MPAFLVRETGRRFDKSNRASSTPVLRQDPSKTSWLKTVHRTVFLTPLTLLGFKSLNLFQIKKDTPYGVSLFYARDGT